MPNLNGILCMDYFIFFEPPMLSMLKIGVDLF